MAFGRGRRGQMELASEQLGGRLVPGPVLPAALCTRPCQREHFVISARVDNRQAAWGRGIWPGTSGQDGVGGWAVGQGAGVWARAYGGVLHPTLPARAQPPAGGAEDVGLPNM